MKQDSEDVCLYLFSNAFGVLPAYPLRSTIPVRHFAIIIPNASGIIIQTASLKLMFSIKGTLQIFEGGNPFKIIGLPFLL